MGLEDIGSSDLRTSHTNEGLIPLSVLLHESRMVVLPIDKKKKNEKSSGDRGIDRQWD